MSIVVHSPTVLESAGQYWSFGSDAISPGDAFMRAMDYSRKTAASVPMNPELANSVATYFACKRVIAEDCGTLPLDGLYIVGKKRTPVVDHPVLTAFNYSPDSEMSGQAFIQLLIDNALGWGGGFAEIVRNGSGETSALNYIHPSRIRIVRGAGQRLVYLVHDDNGAPTPLEARDVFHVKGMSFDGINGYSIARCAAETLGLAKAEELFGASFFGNGANPSVLLSHPSKLSTEARNRVAESWKNAYSGIKNAYKTAILEEGLQVTRLDMPLQDAQFIEGRDFNSVEICRWFRVNPHKVQNLGRATWGNLEQLNIDHANSTLMPWAKRIENEVDMKLVTNSERSRGLRFRFNFNAFMRGDIAARGSWYKTMRDIGAYSVNDILELEDREPVEGGDTRLRPLNYVPLDAPYDQKPIANPNGAKPAAASDASMSVAYLWAASELHRLVVKEAKVVIGANRLEGIERNERIQRHFELLRADVNEALRPVYASVGDELPESFATEWVYAGLGVAMTFAGDDESEYLNARIERCA